MDQSKRDLQPKANIPQPNKTERFLKALACTLLVAIGEYFLFALIGVMIFCGGEGYGCKVGGVVESTINIIILIFLGFDIWLFSYLYKK
ncbi:MAG: hypothetical protein M1324_03210 [Patescibacteria group bacterium]|nr:hypothetical protein [Patescibacteria group bacterium]